MVWSQKIAVVVAWLCEREWERLFTFMRRWAPLFRRRQAGTVVDDERRKERLFVVEPRRGKSGRSDSLSG